MANALSIRVFGTASVESCKVGTSMNYSKATHRIRYGFAITVCAATLTASVPLAQAASLPTRSVAQIRARWQQLRPRYTGSSFDTAPRLSAPFAAGSLTSGVLKDGVNSINYARYIAGLPDDVVLDSTLTKNAQHGAVLLAVGQLAHSQAKPALMPDDFFALANTATSSSNIGSGYHSLWDFNVSCLADADSSNIDRLGHRRWILNPAMQKTGMGLAKTSTDTWTFDRSRKATVQYDSVNWPAAGQFPVEMFGAHTPWSITLNPAVYAWTPGAAGHTITMRRARDGRVWTFTSADTDTSGEYFNFETNGYGVANCFIFRPDPAALGSYRSGDVFDVTLSGGITKKVGRGAVTVSYRTQFVSHSAPSAYVLTPVARTTMSRTRYYPVYGTLRPRRTAGSYPVRIYRQRYVAGAWKSYGYVKARASNYKTYTKYSRSVRLPYAGKWRLRAYAPAVSGRAAMWSGGYDYVTVK